MSCDEYFVIVCVGGAWQSENGELVYVRPFLKNYGVDFPADITYSELFELVKEKTSYENIITNINLGRISI